MKKIWKHRYQIVDEIGKGGNGKVYKVWDLHLEKEWAMKMLEEKAAFGHWQNDVRENINELKALKKISHPNFPRIVDAFEEDDRSVLIMDYIRGITLKEMIDRGSVNEEEMVLIFSQICEALLYLHQNTPVLLYLDLKPSNIMIEENKTVKLVDLGSVSIKGNRGRISGSFGYASPEQVKVQKDGIYLREQSDIFSFGMVLYAVAAGSSTKLPVMEEKSRYGVFIRREHPFLSLPLEKIIEKCTRGNSSRRYASMREVKKDIELWGQYLKKKKKVFRGVPFWYRNDKSQWYQEKSIFCTEGRHSFYIAKKIMIFLVCGLCLIPGKESRAGERNVFKEQLEKEEVLFAEKNEEMEYQKLEVIIRDYKYRKVLVKEGTAYETRSNILLEIPWEEMEGEKFFIRIECENESREKKTFSLECVYNDDLGTE